MVSLFSSVPSHGSLVKNQEQIRLAKAFPVLVNILTTYVPGYLAGKPDFNQEAELIRMTVVAIVALTTKNSRKVKWTFSDVRSPKQRRFLGRKGGRAVAAIDQHSQ